MPQAEAGDYQRPSRERRIRTSLAKVWHRPALAGTGRWLALSTLFALAAIVQTWPLVLHLRGEIVDWLYFPFDEWYYIWSLWWIKHSLIELHQSPYDTNFLLYPQGADLHLQLITVSGILSIPPQLVTGNLILSANLVALGSVVLSGLTMYALSYRITRNHVAAFVSGYIFAFCPFVLMHFTAHWNISATWPLPLLALFLVRFEETRRLREAVFAGICGAILTYNWVEYAVDGAVLVGLFVAFWLLTSLLSRSWTLAGRYCLGFAIIVFVWSAVASPILIPGLQEVSDEGIYPSGGDEYFSGDLLAFVTPSPLWGDGDHFIFPQGPHLSTGSEEGTAFLGFVPLLLAGLAFFGLRRKPRQVLFWTAVFLVFAILSLGPYLYIDQSKDFTLFGLSFSVPLPYQIYDKLPALSSRRIPARMIIIGIMALSVLAGIGFILLLSWVARHDKKMLLRAAAPLITAAVVGVTMYVGAGEYGLDEAAALRLGGALSFVSLAAVCLAVLVVPLRLGPAARGAYRPLVPLLALLIAGLVVFEYWNPPVHLAPLATPAVLSDIADEPGDFTVVDAPLGRRTGFTYTGHDFGGPLANYYQTLYAKRSFGGYVSRVKSEGFAWIHEQPGLRYLACPQCPELPAQDDLIPERVRSVFHDNRIRYVIVHKLDPRGFPMGWVGEREITGMDSYLRSVAGMTQIYSDNSLAVYRNPSVQG